MCILIHSDSIPVRGFGFNILVSLRVLLLSIVNLSQSLVAYLGPNLGPRSERLAKICLLSSDISLLPMQTTALIL